MKLLIDSGSEDVDDMVILDYKKIKSKGNHYISVIIFLFIKMQDMK